jgi:hypothetical protein
MWQQAAFHALLHPCVSLTGCSKPTVKLHVRVLDMPLPAAPNSIEGTCKHTGSRCQPQPHRMDAHAAGCRPPTWEVGPPVQPVQPVSGIAAWRCTPLVMPHDIAGTAAQPGCCPCTVAVVGPSMAAPCGVQNEPTRVLRAAQALPLCSGCSELHCTGGEVTLDADEALP